MTRALQKGKGHKMEGLGKHYSSTEGKPVQGHSLVQTVYVLLGRGSPLAPQMYLSLDMDNGRKIGVVT